MRETRGCSRGKWIEFGVSNKAKVSFLVDAIRLWNKAPVNLKLAKTIIRAKEDIKKGMGGAYDSQYKISQDEICMYICIYQAKIKVIQN